jgi:type IV secretion system protein VirD4
MKARDTAGAVGLPEAERNFRGQSRYALFVLGYAIILLIAANIGMTQWLARSGSYAESLGSPLFGHFYAPWSWFAWKDAFLHGAKVKFFEGTGLVGAGLFVFGMIGFQAIAYRSRRAKPVTKMHGSAHWATTKEIQKCGLIPQEKERGAGVYVGAWEDPKKRVRYLRHNGPEHVLAFAPTRSGKGIGLIIPTLLSWEQSVVIYDLKGENWALTSGWRKQAGHKVLKFDPMDSARESARWNPLAEVRLGTVNEVADVQNIVHMVIDPDGKGIVEHWDKTSLMFLVGVVLYVLHTAKAKGRVGTLPDVAAAMTSEGGIDKLYTEMKENKVVKGESHPVITGSAIDMMEKEERERGSVLSTAKTFFLLYADPVVAANVATSDFSIQDLMHHKDPVSLYIVVDPANKERLKPLVRLLVTQIVRGLTPRLAFKEGMAVQGYKHRLLLLLDEFPALGKLPIFQDALAHISGYGIKAYLITQDLSQLTGAYGTNESITSNCHIKAAYAPNRLETAEMLSKMTGTATGIKRVVGTSGKRGSLVLNQVNESLQEFARPLLTPDECMRLPGAHKNGEGLVTKAGDMLVFVTGEAPIYGRQILYFRDPVFAARAKIGAPRSSDRLSA